MKGVGGCFVCYVFLRFFTALRFVLNDSSGCIQILPPFGRLDDMGGVVVLNDRRERRYAGFFLLEVAIWVEEVVDRGDEEGVVVATGEVSGEGSQIADVAMGVAYDQDSEHLAVLEFVVPFRTGMEVGLYLFGGPYTEGVGRVVEGVGELFR